MGKRQPYECIAIGCGKRGSISALSQHIADKHPNSRFMEKDLIRSMIETGGKLSMGITIEPGKKDQMTTGRERSIFWLGFIGGIGLGVFIAMIGNLAIACNLDKDGFCPPSIQRLLTSGH